MEGEERNRVEVAVRESVGKIPGGVIHEEALTAFLDNPTINITADVIGFYHDEENAGVIKAGVSQVPGFPNGVMLSTVTRKKSAEV